jgi:hypothetical protein
MLLEFSHDISDWIVKLLLKLDDALNALLYKLNFYLAKTIRSQRVIK